MDKPIVPPDYKPHSITYRELETTAWPEDVFIGGGLLSRGDRFLLGAESKGGKSTLMNGLSRQLITGGDFLGFKVTRPLKVLYCQAELRENRLKERLNPSLENLTDEEKSRFFIWNTKNQILISDPSSVRKIEMEMAYRNPDIWEIDPMINFHTFDENDASKMSLFFREVDRIKDMFNVAVIMSHHFRKAPQQLKKNQKVSLLEQIRGSSALRGWADSTLAMEGRTETEYRELEFELRNCDEPFKRIIRYNKTTKDFDWHDPVAQISAWLPTVLNGKDLGAEDVKKLILAEHGALFSHNRNKVQSLFNILINTNYFLVKMVGPKKVLKVR